MSLKGMVSIITPSYNTGEYILETIISVQKQTYTNWEMIIVDDCSSDNTREVLKGIDDNRVKIYFNDENKGAAYCRNRALTLAKGEWIAFLDSDDLWQPEKLAKQLEFMIKNNYMFSYTKYCEIDQNGNQLGRIISGPAKITKRGMYNYCWPGCLTVMYKKDEIGLIQITEIKKNNDYAMWLKIAKSCNCYLLPENLAFYRRRPGSISNHGYFSLIKWHYKLFLECDNNNVVFSFAYTIRNIFYGFVKKIIYVKRL